MEKKLPGIGAVSMLASQHAANVVRIIYSIKVIQEEFN
jgi:hypothetical protein